MSGAAGLGGIHRNPGVWVSALLMVLHGCGAPRRADRQQTSPPRPAEILLSLDPSKHSWRAEPEASASFVAFEHRTSGEAALVVTPIDGGAERRIVSVANATSLRGRRAHLEVNAKLASTAGPSDIAMIRLVATRRGRQPGYWDRATSAPIRDSQSIRAVVTLDVPHDAESVRIELVARGTVPVTFDGLTLTRMPAVFTGARELGVTELDRLAALARLVGYLRFFHPADQSAKLDWLLYQSEAVDRLLAARDDSESFAAFSWLTAAAAPTATVLVKGSNLAVSPEHTARPPGQFLTRWHHVGFGPRAPYASFRAGIDEPEHVGVMFWKHVPARDIGRCSNAVVHADWGERDGALATQVGLRTMSGFPWSETISSNGHAKATIPDGTAAVAFGFGVRGHGTIDVKEVTLSCGARVVARLAPGENLSGEGTGSHLYDVESASTCGAAKCIRVSRLRDVEWDSREDVAEVDLGAGLSLRMPLAVWTDGTRTLPAAPLPNSDRVSTPGELSVRLATVLDTWSTLLWFYPYLSDLGIPWDSVLRPALRDAALADDPDSMQYVMQRIASSLRDNHAGALRLNFDAGVMPVRVRKIADELYVEKGIGPYGELFKMGSTIESIDGVDAKSAVAYAASTLSAATQGWSDQSLSIYLGYGERGDFIRLALRSPTGARSVLAVPRLDLPSFVGQLRESRPASGTEVAKGVLYVDLDHLDASEWEKLLPKATSATNIIFDLRGGVTNQVFDIVAHFLSSELRTPFMDIPIVTATEPKTFERSFWSLFPKQPRLTARAFFLVDGRATSTHETILQMIKDGEIATLVGEQTGGTNGNITWFKVGGFAVKFTGMRVVNQDGSLIHGIGIAPDLVVHPTAAGIQGGRDEILEAAINAAKHVPSP